MSQQGYYTSSSSKDRSSTSSDIGADATNMISRTHFSTSSQDDRRLPPIRDLFKALDETQQASSTQGYARDTETRESRVHLPPLTGQTDPAYHSSSSHRHPSSHTAPGPNYSYFDNRQASSGSSSRAAERSSSVAPGQYRPSSSIHALQDDDLDPEKRYKCEYCGKRFDRPSSLQVHIRTHTGVQPYTCEWPGCARTFNVKSNMLRHWRSHERSDLVQEQGYFSNSESHDPNQRSARTSTGRERSGGSFSHLPNKSTGYHP